ncbi:phosphotransferase [Actinocorallia populi]|uniref:phosphotransferase n=1 Tax=Actinocorallia populi TaxID=2079200 RepID=UPI000D08C24B|nr:phosphotransferase [Actinocorallia populi]
MGHDYDRVTDLGRPNPTRRHGAVVTHPAQPWTSTVHAFLRHLEAEGFQAAPRVVGAGFDGSGDETLTWLEGTVHATSVWPDAERSMHEVGALLHRIHRAARSFAPPPDAVWMPAVVRALRRDTAGAPPQRRPWGVCTRGSVVLVAVHGFGGGCCGRSC